MSDLNPKKILILIVAFLTALTVHEYAHGRAALSAGDDTAQRAGRLTLNPFAHLDPLGSIFFLIMLSRGYGIGWAKPVPVNPMRFRNPRWDNLKVSIWGPLSNMLLAILLAAVFRFLIVPYAPDYIELLQACIAVNIMLAFFNILPIPPLDGSHILSSFLPTVAARRYDYAMSRYGMIILVLVIISGSVTGHSIIDYLLGKPVDTVYALLTGISS